MKALPPFKLTVSKENLSLFSLKVIVSTEPPLGTKQTQLIASKFVLKSRGYPAPHRTGVQLRLLPACLPLSCVCLSLCLLDHLPPPVSPHHWSHPAVQPAMHSTQVPTSGLRSDVLSATCFHFPCKQQWEVAGYPDPGSVHLGVTSSSDAGPS